MYNIPHILNESVEILSDLANGVNSLATLNALNSKVANLVSLKGCKFKQYSNSVPCTLAYYCMAFMHSGSHKDLIVDCINNYLLSFVPNELTKHIEDYKINYEEEQKALRTGKNIEKQIDEELEKIREANFEIANANYTGLYREAEQIGLMNYGSLYIRMGELGDFLDLASSGDRGKKETYQKLKDIYEGTFYPSIIAGDSKRKTIKGVPVQIYLYTDFENLYDVKVKEYFISSLKTGMARRSFIYIPSDKPQKRYPKRPGEKEEAIYKSKAIQERFKTIFNIIEENTIYQLSEEAKDMLYDYQCRCIDYFFDSKDNIIVRIEKKESYWKIQKLAVVYSVIDNPTNTVVSSKYVQMAIDFYNLISPSLRNVIEKRKKNEIELYAEYIANNKDDIITRTDLRSLNHVHSSKFKRFWQEHEDEIKEELDNNYNLLLYPYESNNKSLKAYQVVKK
ncbi:MAG: hypothetical protein ACI4S3_07320 [Candidatus Gastranaerophilaceae bacterium]